MKRFLLFFGILLLSAAGYGQVDHLVISQVYGGGGNSGATYKNDFIELFNPTLSPIIISGWSVQYASATGSSWAVTILSNDTIPAGGYYLIQEVAGSGGTVNLPIPDATGTIAMSATGGKVALVNSTTALTGQCPTGGMIVDFVGFGSANCFEGSDATPAPSNTNAVFRKNNGCTDIDNNSNDFFVAIPNPRNSLSPLHWCINCDTNIEIESILINSCGGSTEGENEMFRFFTNDTINTSNILVDWPSNPWLDICQNSTTASIVSAINATITAGGQLIEPISGFIPPNSQVMFFTSTDFDYTLFDFTDLNYNLYVIFQCPGNTNGHFVNEDNEPGNGCGRTLTLTINGCDIDTVTYDACILDNIDGEAVDFEADGTPTYGNTGGCVAPMFELPVELLSLSGKRTSESSIILNWTTLTETNNNYFEVQKLIGDEYQIIDIVRGSGNSNQKIDYEYIDNNAGVKIQYYRLRQVDYDGNFEYYGPIAVDASLNYKYDLVVYPNPTDDKINIKLNYKGIIEKIALTTITGKEIPVGFNIKCNGETNITLSISNIESGTYLIKFSFSEGDYIHKDKIVINH